MHEQSRKDQSLEDINSLAAGNRISNRFEADARAWAADDVAYRNGLFALRKAVGAIESEHEGTGAPVRAAVEQSASALQSYVEWLNHPTLIEDKYQLMRAHLERHEAELEHLDRITAGASSPFTSSVRQELQSFLARIPQPEPAPDPDRLPEPFQSTARAYLKALDAVDYAVSEAQMNPDPVLAWLLRVLTELETHLSTAASVHLDAERCRLLRRIVQRHQRMVTSVGEMSRRAMREGRDWSGTLAACEEATQRTQAALARYVLLEAR